MQLWSGPATKATYSGFGVGTNRRIQPIAAPTSCARASRSATCSDVRRALPPEQRMHGIYRWLALVVIGFSLYSVPSALGLMS